MGFFDAFKKKQCDLCGGDIGLLGNRKLEDGNMCKDCAKKLSPWFDDRRHSTVEQIKAQLEYREANREKVAEFNTTRSVGSGTKLLVDEDAGVFMVTSARNLQEANPDVIKLSDVTGCNLDIDEREREIMQRNEEGEEESYRPPRFEHSYDFYVEIHVRNPYFDDLRFKLNGSSVDIEERGMRPTRLPGILGVGGVPAGGFDPERDPDFRRYKEMGEEIRDLLLNARQQVRDAAAAAAAPKAAVVCPYCGATTTPDEKGRCEYCGGAV